MRKTLMTVLCLLFLISGCTKKPNEQEIKLE